MLDDTWQARDFPVLLEVARQADRQPRGLWLPIAQVAEATGLSEEDVQTAAHWLAEAGLVQVDRRADSVVAFQGIAVEARTKVGLWPTPEVAADRLIAALRQSVEEAATPEEKTKRQKILASVLEGGRDFIVSVAAGVLTGQVGS
jgi:hypothetical protein